MRVRPDDLADDAADAWVAALGQSGLKTRPGAGGVDVILDGPSGPIGIDVKAVCVGKPSRLAALIRVHPRRKVAGIDVVVVVADEISGAARELLRNAGWGYLDRRGRLWFRTGGVLINDTDLEPSLRHPGEASGTDPLAGRVGLAMGVWLLMHPDQRHGVRGLARCLGVLHPARTRPCASCKTPRWWTRAAVR